METVYVFITNKKPDRINISSQGYENSFNPNMGNEDSLYIVEPNLFNRYIIQYFPNVMGVPNMEFFLLFHSFCKQYNIDVIYLMTPKSKYYNMLVNNSYFDEWYSIKRNLNKLKVELWDYENINQEIITPINLYNATHLSSEGAELFTQIIIRRLYNHSEY